MLSSVRRGVFIALLALFGAASSVHAQWSPQAYFSPKGGAAAATAERIDAAEESVDVAMYSISTSGPIWEALQRAVDRGIEVRVILNKGHSSNKRKARALEDIGAHVFSVSRTMHEKFALVDAGKWWRRKLVNGSANWSTGAETRYSENTVVYGRHYHLFYAFQQEFNLLLSKARPLSEEADEHMEPVELNTPSRRIRRYERAVFTSANSGGSTVVADEIIAMMQRAERSIFIDVAHFNSVTLAQALIDLRAAKPELEIQVLLDQGEYSDRKSRARDLEAGGIDVRYKTYSLAFSHSRSQLMHHKTMIIDETDLITGSYNWSDTAEHKNYENVIVVTGHERRNRRMVDAFVEEHERLWDADRDVYPEFLAALQASAGDANYQRVVPIHFDTDYFRAAFALTRAEVQPLRSAAWAMGVFGRTPDGRRIGGYSYLDREAGDVFADDPVGTFLGEPEAGELADANARGIADLIPN